MEGRLCRPCAQEEVTRSPEQLSTCANSQYNLQEHGENYQPADNEFLTKDQLLSRPQSSFHGGRSSRFAHVAKQTFVPNKPD